MLSKKEVRRQWWHIIEFIFNAIFLVVLSTLISRIWSSHFYTNSHVSRMFEIAQYPNLGSIPFYDIHNISEFETYLEIEFVQTLYNVRWYNKFPICNDKSNLKYWSADFTHKMIGLPVIRQLRVKPEPCNKMVIKKGDCIPKWSYSESDTDVYGVGWTPANWYDTRKNNSPWKYTFKSTVFTPVFNRLIGNSGRLYSQGGYLQTLGPLRQQTELDLAELKAHRWQDVLTRVLIIELTLYDVNMDVFTQVTLIAEYMASGTLLLKAQALSVEGSRRLNGWIFVLIAFIIIYILRSVYLINKLGLLEYLSTLQNVSRLIVVALGCLSIVVYFIHYYSSASYSEQFQNRIQESDFDYDLFAIFYIYLLIILSVLLCFAILRVIMLIRGGRSLITYWYTFTLSLSWLVWLSIIISLFVMILYQIPLLLKIFVVNWNRAFLLERGSLRKLTYSDIMQVRVFIYFKAIFNYTVSSFYIVLFIYYGRLAKRYKPKDTDGFNFVTFLVSQLTNKYKSCSK